jgi:hypothetical protein
MNGGHFVLAASEAASLIKSFFFKNGITQSETSNLAKDLVTSADV